jgi:hypothetical protein
MAVTWTVQTVAKVPGLANLPTDAAVTLTGDNEISFDLNVDAGQTKELDFGSIDKTKLVAYVFHSSATAVTLNTNAVDATGGNSFALAAAKAVEWDNTQLVASQITQSVTKLFIINVGAKTTIFRGAFLSNL